MRSTPTKPTNTGTLTKTEDTKQDKKSSWRIAVYIIVSAVCEGLLIVAANVAQQKQPILTVFLFSLVPSVVLGIAFAIIQNFDDRTRSLENSIKKSTQSIESLNAKNSENENKLSHIMDDFGFLVKDTGTTLKFYSTVRKILDDGYSQKDLIRTFLEKAMNGPLSIQPMEAGEFYDIAEKGIKQCTESWQAIHQGSIKNLDVNFKYLDELKRDNSQPRYKNQVAEKPLRKQCSGPQKLERSHFKRRYGKLSDKRGFTWESTSTTTQH